VAKTEHVKSDFALTATRDTAVFSRCRCLLLRNNLRLRSYAVNSHYGAMYDYYLLRPTIRYIVDSVQLRNEVGRNVL